MNNLLITLISSTIAFSAGCLLKGRLDSGQEAKTQLQASNLKYERQTQNIATDQQSVRKYMDETQKQQVIYRTIYKERIKYVKENPANDVYVNSYWVCMADKAADPTTMQHIDCKSYAIATAATFRINTIIANVQHNYETCNEIRTQLINLIDLIKEQK